MIIPSIDLSCGQAVQWRQGRDPVLARDDVFELLERFSLYGEVAVIDLDAATGAGSNAALIRELLATGAPIRVGGGIRDLDTARNWLKDGAARVILGTAAREDWVAKLPTDRVVVALDARGDEWTTHGWREGSGQQVADLVAPLAERCGAFLYTQVEKEGMMEGVDWERVEQVVRASPVPVTVAGGITTPEDVARLHRLGADAQIGMAIYTGALDLADAFVAQVDFAKGDGLVPTVVQDAASGEVLMLAYSNEDEPAPRALRSGRHVLEPLPRRALGERRDQRPPPEAPTRRPRLRRRHAPLPRRAERPRLPPPAPLVLPLADRPVRARDAGPRPRRPGGEPARGLLHR